jgi:hypothetical protein
LARSPCTPRCGSISGTTPAQAGDRKRPPPGLPAGCARRAVKQGTDSCYKRATQVADLWHHDSLAGESTWGEWVIHA